MAAEWQPCRAQLVGRLLGHPLHPPTPYSGVEMFKKQLNEGQAGDNVGLLIRGLKRDDVERGQVGFRSGHTWLHQCGQVGIAVSIIGCTNST